MMAKACDLVLDAGACVAMAIPVDHPQRCTTYTHAAMHDENATTSTSQLDSFSSPHIKSHQASRLMADGSPWRQDCAFWELARSLFGDSFPPTRPIVRKACFP